MPPAPTAVPSTLCSQLLSGELDVLDEPLQPSPNYDKMLRELSLAPSARPKTLQPDEPGASAARPRHHAASVGWVAAAEKSQLFSILGG